MREVIGVVVQEDSLLVCEDGGETFRFNSDDLIRRRGEILDFLLSERIKIFYDSKPVLKFLRERGYSVSKPIFDISLARKIIEGKADNSSGSPEVCDFFSIREGLIKEMTKCGLLEVGMLEFDCVFAVVEMELFGIKLDLNKWRKLEEKYLSEQERLKKELFQGFGVYSSELNLNSPQQMLRAFSDKGIFLKSTSHQALSEYKDKNELIKKFLEYRQVTKAITSFLSPIPKYVNDRTGRIHPIYNQIGALSGRFSCEEPNIQQIPRGGNFRECFVPEKGNKLIIADYSQIELRVAAEIAGDEVMKKAYAEGVDLHLLTASLVTEKPIEEISKGERQAAKAMNFGLVYGMGAKGFQIYAKSTYGVSMSLREAIVFRNKFFESYRGIAEWHKRTEEDDFSGEIRTLSGRRVVFDEPPNFSTRLNVPVQGTAADIIKKALGDLVSVTAKLKGSIIAVVHDEILLEVPSLVAESAAKELKEAMEAAGRRYLKNIPVVAEAAVANSWAEK